MSIFKQTGEGLVKYRKGEMFTPAAAKAIKPKKPLPKQVETNETIEPKEPN